MRTAAWPPHAGTSDSTGALPPTFEMCSCSVSSRSRSLLWLFRPALSARRSHTALPPCSRARSYSASCQPPRSPCPALSARRCAEPRRADCLVHVIQHIDTKAMKTRREFIPDIHIACRQGSRGKGEASGHPWSVLDSAMELRWHGGPRLDPGGAGVGRMCREPSLRERRLTSRQVPTRHFAGAGPKQTWLLRHLAPCTSLRRRGRRRCLSSAPA